MRSRQEILKEYKPDTYKMLEVLLDIRDLLTGQQLPVKTETAVEATVVTPQMTATSNSEGLKAEDGTETSETEDKPPHRKYKKHQHRGKKDAV